MRKQLEKERESVCGLSLCQLSACSLSIITMLKIDHTHKHTHRIVTSSSMSISICKDNKKESVWESEEMCVEIQLCNLSVIPPWLLWPSPWWPTGSARQRSTRGHQTNLFSGFLSLCIRLTLSVLLISFLSLTHTHIHTHTDPVKRSKFTLTSTMSSFSLFLSTEQACIVKYRQSDIQYKIE